jgi:branched-chain amino acid transport system ATP-binding protein
VLQVSGVSTGYGDTQVLWDVTLAVPDGAMVGLIGANGAGKSTLLGTISGLLAPWQGQITLAGQPLGDLRPEQRVGRGIAHVPQGRRLFAGLTVEQNLRLGAYRRADRERIGRDLDRVGELFPVLRERFRQYAGSLSGGEQQMCAIGRALMSDPKLLLLDEPSAGLAPVVVQQVFELVQRIRAGGLTVLIVEQNVQHVLRVVDRAYLLEAGHIRASGTSAQLLASNTIKQAYLGV